MGADREPRDVLGEALRQMILGVLAVSRWESIPEHDRENWRCVADRQIIARLAEAGYRIVKGADDAR